MRRPISAPPLPSSPQPKSEPSPKPQAEHVPLFRPRPSLVTLLRFVRQGEDDAWLLMERATNRSHILRSSGHKFVNNHFWNCYEDEHTSEVVVEAVPATSDYLDNYFESNLKQKSTPWGKLLTSPLVCRVPMLSDARHQRQATGATRNDTIACTLMFGSEASTIKTDAQREIAQSGHESRPAKLSAASSVLAFDYPTFNPRFKMRSYQYFYAIAPASTTSRWFDTLIKVNRASTPAVVVSRWASPGIFLTEADFVPRSRGLTRQDEDDGLLITILYNSTSDESLFAVFDARTLTPTGIYPMGVAVPFHAHGIVCVEGEACFTNP